MPDTHDKDQHQGKAIVIIDEDKFTIRAECDHCGDFEVGPIPIHHVATMGRFLVEVAQSRGIQSGNITTYKKVETDDPRVVEEGIRQFERMPISPDGDEGDPWGKEGE